MLIIMTTQPRRKTSEDFFNKIYIPLTLFVRVRKGCMGFCCERELDTEQKLQYSDPHSYGRQRCVFLVLLMLNRKPCGPLSWVLAFFTASYQHLLRTSTHRGQRPLRPDVASLPHLVYILLQLYCNWHWDSNSTELYNSSTSTRSPTRSLKSHV